MGNGSGPEGASMESSDRSMDEDAELPPGPPVSPATG